MKNRIAYLALLLIYAFGADITIMEVDAAQYASIAREMLDTGEFLQVHNRYQDYLDKPPLLFWLSACSMNFFGIGSWQYKLPSILFAMFGVFSTFRLGKLLYGPLVGHRAALIWGSCLAMLMTANDIKTDTILTASIVFSIWMLVRMLNGGSTRHAVGAGIGIACAMLTKGPIGLMMPLLAIGGHVVSKQEWKLLRNTKWLLVLGVVAALLVPMCVGLYRQFGTDGLKFYFWTQSFGRITGENPWKDDTTVFYFFHVFLWAFIPWTLLGASALIHHIRNLFSNEYPERFVVSGVLLVWLGLSLSRFKLPHYIFVVFPLISILAAHYLSKTKHLQSWSRVQLILSLLLFLTLTVCLPYVFPQGGMMIPILIALLGVFCVLIWRKTRNATQVFWPTFVASVAIGMGLNLHFYPQLLPYQANSEVGKWAVTNQRQDDLVSFGTGGHALDFYTHRIVPWAGNLQEVNEAIRPGAVIYANEKHYHELLASGLAPNDTMRFQNFSVQRLSLEFLDPATRNSALNTHYLLFY